jgi:hypothetical protein
MGMTGTFYLAQLFIGWDGVPLNFCLSWPWTTIFSISASWVVKVKGMSHHTWFTFNNS